MHWNKVWLQKLVWIVQSFDLLLLSHYRGHWKISPGTHVKINLKLQLCTHVKDSPKTLQLCTSVKVISDVPPRTHVKITPNLLRSHWFCYEFQRRGWRTEPSGSGDFIDETMRCVSVCVCVCVCLCSWLYMGQRWNVNHGWQLPCYSCASVSFQLGGICCSWSSSVLLPMCGFPKDEAVGTKFWISPTVSR